MLDGVILAIASTTPTVLALLQRLVKDVVLEEHASTVPWTIANKYYTADVKFLVHPLSWAAVQHDLSAPALLFVWNKGEPYRDQIRTLSRHASRHAFEVVLAIRLSPASSTSEAEIEDDQDTDAYLSSNGFEFVDVPDFEPSLPDRTGILGIPRVIDALSTIMWPSMVPRGFGTAQTNPGISSDEYHHLARLVGEKISGDRMQREFQEIERWLDEDDMDTHSAIGEDEVVPWSTVVTPGTLSPSSSGFLEISRPATPKAGFDDDFTYFVSASSTSPAGMPGAPSKSSPSFPSTSFSSSFNFDLPSSGHSTPIWGGEAGSDATRLAPSGLYKSLGSVSDFGDESIDGSDMEGDDMPSRVDVVEISREIFGGISPVEERGFGPQSCPVEQVDVEMADADLDLHSVLQGLKEEIAGMPDDERRQAAARVALGLAYGLEDVA